MKQLMRKNISTLVPYSSARNEFSGKGSIYIDANENYRDFVGEKGLNRYPDPQHIELKREIEKVMGFLPQQIVVGNGSDELIDLLFRIFCVPGKDKILMMSPTYGAYKVFADINDISVSYCPLKDDFSIDLERLESQCHLINTGTIEHGIHKLLFICSPNNPTGNSFPLEQIGEIAKRFRGITVIDEAYVDFSSIGSAKALLEQNERIVILRTLSKAYGLANVRIGIAISSPEIIEAMHHVKYPYNVSGIQQEAAIGALRAQKEVEATIKIILNERERVASNLRNFSFVQKVFPSDANFLLVRVDDPTLLYNMLLKKGIIIRNRSSLRGCYGCVRITIGSVSENNALLETLTQLEEIL
ncbi:MAG: histidinol-phosphate transaminase [Spirochaetia bacterium]|nr:histidinol-phosphate transaminase [Spirochaetia bacterium]